MIDNYDSFTYNLFQYFSELGSSVEVWRNDSFELDDIKGFDPDLIVISPGPSRPEKAGLSMEVVQTFADTYPILGVCLGHQVIGAVFGARVIRAERIMHGKTSQVFHNEKNLFRGVSNPVTATRYHSLIIENENLPDKISWVHQEKERQPLNQSTTHPANQIFFSAPPPSQNRRLTIPYSHFPCKIYRRIRCAYWFFLKMSRTCVILTFLV